MVTRRTRNYKEKKPMTTFGQFILPLTVIMALALLFFSVKLFFFNTDGTDEITVPREETVKQAPADPVPAERPAEITPAAPAVKKVEVKPAQPVDVKKEEAKKESTAAAVKAPAKPAAAVKETAPKTEAPQKTEAKSVRWDIQIEPSYRRRTRSSYREGKKTGTRGVSGRREKNGHHFTSACKNRRQAGTMPSPFKVLEKEDTLFPVEINSILFINIVTKSRCIDVRFCKEVTPRTDALQYVAERLSFPWSVRSAISRSILPREEDRRE